MKQDMIVILDLGSHENTKIARIIRELGVYSEIKPHDITVAELNALPNVKGVILSGGENNIVDGKPIDVTDGLYTAGYPVISFGHAPSRVENTVLPHDDESLKEILEKFVFDTCKAQANWNMKTLSRTRWSKSAGRSAVKKCCLRSPAVLIPPSSRRCWFRR